MVTDSFGFSMADIGYYAGWLTSAYYLSQIFSSIVLGQLSDIKGRRGIMLMGMAGNMVTTLIFGMSRAFWLALLARLICGLVNGNIGVVKSYVREITDETNQARAYTLRSAGWSIGSIVGPMIGGALARPALQYPSLFSQTGLFGYFPFLLPCIASACITAVSFTLGCLYLKETLHLSQPQPQQSSDEEESELQEQHQQQQHQLKDVQTHEQQEPHQQEEANEKFSVEDDATESTLEASIPLESDAEPIDDDGAASPASSFNPASSESSPSSTSTSTSTPSFPGSSFSPSPMTPIQASPRRYHLLRVQSALGEFNLFMRQLFSRLKFFKQALQERDVVVCIILYTGVSFVALGFDEVFGFWSIRPVSQGGIAFSTLQIGASHAISGVAMIIMQIFAYVPMDRILGTQNALTLSMTLVAPAFILVSFACNLADRKVLLWALITIVMTLKAGFGTTGFAAVNLLVNNAAGSSTVGAVNGLSASTAAIGRVLAPVVIGSIFAVTANSSAGFPFDYHFVFICLSFLTALVAIGSHFALPETINKRKA